MPVLYRCVKYRVGLLSLYVFSNSLACAQAKPFDFRRVAPYASFDFALPRYAQDERRGAYGHCPPPVRPEPFDFAFGYAQNRRRSEVEGRMGISPVVEDRGRSG